MNSVPRRPVTTEERSLYEEDGVVCLRGLFDGEWIERMGRAVDRAVETPGPMVLNLSQGKAGRFHGDTFVWTWDEDFRAFVFDSPAAAIAAEIMGASRINLFFDTLLVKEPGSEAPTPWHHDLPYWPIAGWQVCTVWVPFDPVYGDSGTVEYVAGSHRWGQRFQPLSFTGDDRYGRALPAIPDIEAEREQHRIVSFELQPGDCLVHHGLTVHGAGGNRQSSTRRRALATRWCGDDCTYKPEGSVQPLIRDPGIASGAPMDCELFPRVWPRAA